MIKWTGLAPWEFEFPFPGSITSTFLVDNYILQYVMYGKVPRLPQPSTFLFFFFITLEPRIE